MGPRFSFRAAICTAMIAVTMPAMAQFKTDVVNSLGAEAPCVGIGPVGGAAARKCVDAFLMAGFIRSTDLGWSGLTIGTTGADDGVVKKVDPNSPASRAGMEPGVTVMAVGKTMTHRSPSDIATQMLFGKAGTTVHLVLRRDGSEQTVDVVRSAIGAPAQPAWPGGFMISYKPLINWRGQFAPCIGAGPAGAAGIELCNKKFMPYGYIKVTELGATGIRFAPESPKAVVAVVEDGSASAKAGVKPGDEIVAIDGKALTASVGEQANELLFGKSADVKEITVHGPGGEKTFNVTLSPRP